MSGAFHAEVRLPETLFDLYVNLQSAGQVCMHPKITRFLGLVFQAKVLAFRQYFHDPDFRGIEPYWDVGGFACSFYKLPNLSQPVRPMPRWQFYT